MSIVKQQTNHPFFKILAKRFDERLKELGITKYAFCNNSKFSRSTCYAIMSGNRSFSVAALLEYLDAVGLELRIVKKRQKTKKR